MYGGKFSIGDRVRIHLYDRAGRVLGTIEGRVADFAPETEVAPGMRKNLVYVTHIQGYQRPDATGELQDTDEGWFADTDLEKVEDEEAPGPRFFAN